MTRYTSRRPPRYHRPESGFLKGLGLGMGVGCGTMLVTAAVLIVVPFLLWFFIGILASL